MLTLEKLKVYKSFQGDVDFFGRSGSKKIKNKITEDEFRLIDELVQGMILVKNNLASSEFENEVMNKMKQLFGSDYSDNQELFNEIVELQMEKIKDIFK